ncbi:MAG: hypothetical protein MMC33_000702 [Icmadophila ericetorum]|nr:hypothetical protein [Icmadophila ericetorum]
MAVASVVDGERAGVCPVGGAGEELGRSERLSGVRLGVSSLKEPGGRITETGAVEMETADFRRSFQPPSPSPLPPGRQLSVTEDGGRGRHGDEGGHRDTEEACVQMRV